LADRDEAEDAVQEAYAAIWRKAAQYDASIASPISWLAMIAHNKASIACAATAPRATHCRSNSRRRERSAPSAPALAEHAGETRQLDRCLNQLEARRRTLIRTAFFEGATYEELARRTDTPIGTVKSWIRRGLMQLRRAWNHERDRRHLRSPAATTSSQAEYVLGTMDAASRDGLRRAHRPRTGARARDRCLAHAPGAARR
jgi:RNA polymerase sigma-70 factor (ECF subfamily)